MLDDRDAIGGGVLDSGGDWSLPFLWLCLLILVAYSWKSCKIFKTLSFALSCNFELTRGEFGKIIKLIEDLLETRGLQPLDGASVKWSEYWRRWWCIDELDRDICLPTAFIFVNSSSANVSTPMSARNSNTVIYYERESVWEKLTVAVVVVVGRFSCPTFFSSVFSGNKQAWESEREERGRVWNFWKREGGGGVAIEERGEEGRKKMMSGGDHVVGCFGRGLVVFTSLSAWSDPLHRGSMLYGAGRTVGLAWFNPSFGIKKWIHIANLHSRPNFIMFWCIL